MGSDLIRGPVGRVIGLVVWMAVFSLLLGSVNQWYLQSVDAGVIGNERFDRIVLKATTGDTGADDTWAAVTSKDASGAMGSLTVFDPNTAYTVYGGTGDTCGISSANSTGTSVTAGSAYTPSGTVVKTDNSGYVSGCKYEAAGNIFGAGGLAGLIKIILQAAGIAPPIALLFVLGTFGSSFLRNLGGHPILAAVGTIILMLLLATLLNTLVPFLSSAFSAIDGNRFRMYEEGLGSISVIVGNFFGVVLVAGMLMVIWNAVKYFKGHDALGSEGKM